MQTISLKISDSTIKRIDEAIEKHNFATRSEFIRDALREKLESLENQKFEHEIRAYLNNSSKNGGVGNIPPKNTKDLEKAKNDIFVELEKKFGELREHLR